jgi:tripartite-type tricarboxylate transporter receptor subunit TctC
MFRVACALLFVMLTATFAPLRSAAGAYPDKPIRFIVPFSPGGGTDLIARALQPRLQASLGTSVTVDNRPSAGGIVGVALAAKAPPDGYTYLVTSASFTFVPSLYTNLPFDAIKDFKPVTNLATTPLVLCVHPSMPVTNVRQLLDLARKRPGEVLYSSAGVGSNLHLTTELFNYMAKINMKQVPYKGAGAAAIGLMSGEVQVSFLGLLSVPPFIKAGRLRCVAVSSKQRTPALPDLPTIDEAGVPGYDKSGWTGVYAPAAVPNAIIDQFFNSVSTVLKDPATIKAISDQGSTLVGNTPEEFNKFVRAEIDEWANLIRRMKLKPTPL